jgi:hypothetical protein
MADVETEIDKIRRELAILYSAFFAALNGDRPILSIRKRLLEAEATLIEALGYVKKS